MQGYKNNGLKPKSSSEAIIWNYFNDAINNKRTGEKWDSIRIKYWPVKLAKAAMKREMGYTERFWLFCYLYGNGVSPDQIKEAYLYIKDIHYNKYDKGIMHIDNLLKDLKTKNVKWDYWDEHEGQTCYLKTGEPVNQEMRKEKEEEKFVWKWWKLPIKPVTEKDYDDGIRMEEEEENDEDDEWGW